jgi:hypothetical protein
MATIDSIEEILKDESKGIEFEKFLAAETYLSDEFQFLQDVGNWETQFSDIAKSARLARAKRIFKGYIANTGTFHLELSDKVVGEIEALLAVENADLGRDVFEGPIAEIKIKLSVEATRFATSADFNSSPFTTLSERAMSVATEAPARMHPDAKLDSILDNKAQTEAFEKFLESEFAAESFHFIQEVSRWRKTYFGVTSYAHVARARRIFKGFVSEHGSYAINISSGVREGIETLVNANGDVPREIFQDALNEVTQVLSFGPVIRFCATLEYKELTENDS